MRPKGDPWVLGPSSSPLDRVTPVVERTSRSNEVEVRLALEEVARRAAEGDREALTERVCEIKHPIYTG